MDVEAQMGSRNRRKYLITITRHICISQKTKPYSYATKVQHKSSFVDEFFYQQF